MALDMFCCFYLPYMSLHTMVMCKVKTGWPRIIQIKAQPSKKAWIHPRLYTTGIGMLATGFYHHPELWDIMEKQTGFSYRFLEKQAFDKCWQSCLQKANPPSVHIGQLLLLTNNTLIWRDLLPDRGQQHIISYSLSTASFKNPTSLSLGYLQHRIWHRCKLSIAQRTIRIAGALCRSLSMHQHSSRLGCSQSIQLRDLYAKEPVQQYVHSLSDTIQTITLVCLFWQLKLGTFKGSENRNIQGLGPCLVLQIIQSFGAEIIPPCDKGNYCFTVNITGNI